MILITPDIESLLFGFASSLIVTCLSINEVRIFQNIKILPVEEKFIYSLTENRRIFSSAVVHRLNVELIKAKKGGKFVCNKMIWSKWNRIFLFRADTSYHYVTPIDEGERWVLSFGFKPKRLFKT